MDEIPKTAEPCLMVIFGATGDLTRRKLFPALYNLAKDGHLPPNFAIVGVGRQEMQSEQFRDEMIASLKEFAGSDGDQDAIQWFCERTFTPAEILTMTNSFSPTCAMLLTNRNKNLKSRQIIFFIWRFRRIYLLQLPKKS